jgi:hypothetical protein
LRIFRNGALLAHNPGRHGIDVEVEDVAADAVRLKQRRATSHERIVQALAWEIVGTEKISRSGVVPNSRKYEPRAAGTTR